MRMSKTDFLRLKTKASFYYKNNLMCHIKLRPTGHIDGTFTSDIIEDIFYWVQADNQSEPERVFLVDIHEIKDYEKRIEIGEDNNGKET